MRDSHLGEMCNLFGKDYYDLYQLFTDEFNAGRLQQKKCLTHALAALFNKSLDDFILMPAPSKASNVLDHI